MHRGWVGGGGIWILGRSLETIVPGGLALPKEPSGEASSLAVGGLEAMEGKRLQSGGGSAALFFFGRSNRGSLHLAGRLDYRDGFLGCWACCGSSGGWADGCRSLWGQFRADCDGGTGGTCGIGLSDRADEADESTRHLLSSL